MYIFWSHGFKGVQTEINNKNNFHYAFVLFTLGRNRFEGVCLSFPNLTSL